MDFLDNPCCSYKDGGTSIKQWQPGEVLYDHAVMMTKLAMRSSYFGGIIWHQGETDCFHFNKDEYREMLLNTLRSIRTDLDAEDLPLVICEISDKISADYKIRDGVIDEINSLLKDVTNELPLCDIVSVDGLSLKKDGIHYNSASYRELGVRYFIKYKQLRDNFR